MEQMKTVVSEENDFRNRDETTLKALHGKKLESEKIEESDFSIITSSRSGRVSIDLFLEEIKQAGRGRVEIG